MPERRLCKDFDGALAAVRALGWPVALKIQSRALSHKWDVNGVILGVGDEESLAVAWRRFNVAAAASEATIDGVLVESMSAPGVELIVGGRRDPAWGPVLIVGLGGVSVEALQDVRVLPAGLSPEEIATEMGRLKGAALLGRFRGRAPRDVAAAAEVVSTLGRFMRSHREVEELEINPLMVFAKGQGVLALDALIRCR